MQGLVLKSTGSWYQVLCDEIIYECRVRGNLRLVDSNTTNPFAVGDIVNFEIDPNYQNQGIIQDVSIRKNVVLRKAAKKTSESQILASNIDLALLIVTISNPKTSLGFIDRFTVSTESFRIPTHILFNKSDIMDSTDQEKLLEYQNIYTNVGYDCFSLSALTGNGIDQIKSLIDNKMVLLSGHSGVGKSTLINLLVPNAKQRVTEVSDFTSKGVHTTTFAEAFQYNATSFIIDTPGIREFGLAEIENYELADYFPEMRVIRPNCKFNDCTHDHEPQCAILNGVNAGEIAVSRYESYLSMLQQDPLRR